MLKLCYQIFVFQVTSKVTNYFLVFGVKFWCLNLVPFLPDLGFQLLKNLWSSLMYF